MKKPGIYLCAALLALSLASCGKGQDKGDGSEDVGQSVSSDGNQESQGAALPTEETQDAAGTGTQETGGSSIDYEKGWSEEMAGLRAAVVDTLGADYWPDTAILPDMLEMAFGITPDMYEDYMAEMPMISANVDTLLIVRAKDDKVDTVQGALEAYRDTQINGTLQYPMNLGKVQASRIETIGDYVIFVQLGADTGEAAESGDEAVIAMCQETNDLVIETLRGQLGQ